MTVLEAEAKRSKIRMKESNPVDKAAQNCNYIL